MTYAMDMCILSLKKFSGENGYVEKKGRSGSPKNYSRRNASECHVIKKQEKNPAKT